MNDAWRDLPPTAKQVALIDRLRARWDYSLPVPNTRGEAHDAISAALNAVAGDACQEVDDLNDGRDWGSL